MSSTVTETISGDDVESQNLISVNGSDGDGGETNKERRDYIRHLQKEAFQLANYYFVFQGVIFTAFYNTPSNLKCEYHWIPFTLSFLAGFLNLCALSTIAFKYKTTLDEIDRCATREARCHLASSSSGVVGSNLASSNVAVHESIVVECARHWRWFYVAGCMRLFVGFFVITLVGCWTITCGGASANAAAPPSPATT